MAETQNSKPLLGYWDIRGLANYPRILAAYLGIDIEEKRYTPEQEKEWFENDKKKLPLAFPNLPYLIDGDVAISETDAIEVHLIYKAGNKELLGKTAQDQAQVKMLSGVLSDIKKYWTTQVYSPKFHETVDKEIENRIIPKLVNLSKYLGDKDYFLGYLTICDIHFWEDITGILTYKKDLLDAYPNLKKFQAETFPNTPKIKEYLNSDKFVKAPFNSPKYATWP